MATIAVTPAPLDLHFVRGDDVTVLLNFQDADENPVDMSDSTFTAQLRRKPSSEDAISFTVDDSDAADGTVVISLVAADTTNLVNTYYWDIQRHSGTTQTIMGGEITFDRDVTRA